MSKAFALLDAFTIEGTSHLTLARLARSTCLPKATTHRLAATLVSLGALERTSDGSYQLGLRLFELGELVARKRVLREAALPFLQDLYQATRQTVHLGVLDRHDVVYLDRIHGHQLVRAPSAVGGRLPASCTGIGKALLAHSPDTIAEVLAKPLRRRTRYTITSPAVLEAELAEIRARGVSIDREESRLGVSCVAAPVLVDGAAVAAISVSVEVSSVDAERLAPAVLTASLGLARALRNQR